MTEHPISMMPGPRKVDVPRSKGDTTNCLGRDNRSIDSHTQGATETNIALFDFASNSMSARSSGHRQSDRIVMRLRIDMGELTKGAAATEWKGS